MLKVYHHLNAPVWSDVYKKCFLKNQKTNGAYTYSQEIVANHIPAIEDLFEDKNVIIMTVGNPSDLKDDLSKVDFIISYLHERLERDNQRIENNKKLNKKIIYITSRKNVKEYLDEQNIPCIWLPMSIDSYYVKSKGIDIKNRYADRFIFFGNAYFGKRNLFNPLKEFLHSKGYKLDSICNNIYCKEGSKPVKVKRENIFKILSYYKYGAADGRCALEMYSLGLKVFITGPFFGGIITNEEEYKLQQSVNFAAIGEYTFSNSFEKCFENIDKSLNKVLDTREAAQILRKELIKII